jgi:SWI/SNF-related matrix-associated actin-dependent regulator of chromatin subfamily A-like protein 1
MRETPRLPFAATVTVTASPTAMPRARKPTGRVGGVVTVRDSDLYVRFSAKHPPYIAAMKQIRGVRYDDQSYSWVVGIGNLRHVRELAARYGWVLSAAVKALPDLDIADAPVFVSAQGEQLVLSGSYREEVWEMLGESDARYERATGRWYIPAEACLDVVLDLQRLCRIHYVGDTSAITAAIDEAQRMIALSRALEPSPGWALTRPIRGELREFQHPGVEYLVNQRRCFAWATMGAGKTRVSLVALNELDAFPALVIPPAGIKTNWAREVDAVLYDRKVHVCEGRRATLPLETPDVWICNYDILGKHDDTRSWAAAFTSMPLAALVIDEGHRVKNPSAQRTKSVVAISESLPHESPRFLLTGTPVRNKRVEVHPQLAAIGRDGEFGNTRQLREDERLSRRLRSVCAWRPDPKEVLRSLGLDGEDLDPNIIVIDGDAKIMAEYRKAEANLIEFLRQKAIDKAHELGTDPHAAAVSAVLKAQSAEQLMAVNTLSRLAGQAKIHAAREWVSDFLSSGDKLLVFAINRDVMDGIAGDDIPQINGDISHRARQELQDRFQGLSQPDLQAIVLQIQAAGEGLTLTEAWHCLFAQFDWVPGAHDQALARAQWRMNDPHPAQAHYLVCADTIEEDRMAVLDAKREEMKHVTDGDRDTIATTSTFGDVFERLVKRALIGDPG